MTNPARTDSLFDRIQATKATSAKNLSQMDRITTALAAGSAPVASDEEKLLTLESRVKDLKQVKAKLIRLVAKVADLPSLKATDEKLKLVTSARKAVQNMIEAKPPTGVSKHLRACVNELTSLREGIHSGLANTKKSLTLITVANAANEVEAMIEQVHANHGKLKARIAAAAGNGVDESTEEVIRRNQSEVAKMPAMGDKHYTVARVGVIPLMAKQQPTEVLLPRLKHSGFSADDIAGYVAIHNQLVIGINTKKLHVTNKKTNKRVPAVEAAKELLIPIGRAMGTKLRLVTDRGSSYGEGQWFWAMPEREMDRLSKAFGGSLVVQQWGFAFKKHG